MDNGTMELAYFPGSPFARMARVLVREWPLPVRETEYPFPPPRELFEWNPLGQVPALRDGGETFFPTLIILERLWSAAGSPPAAYDPGRDRQLLLTILQAGDALAAAFYQSWSGLGPAGANHVGYDPGERNMERYRQALGWIESRLADRADPGALTLPDVAAACILLWSDARSGPDWSAHAGLAERVRRLDARASFAATRPQVWAPGHSP